MDNQKVLDLVNKMPIKYYDNDIVDGKSIIYIATVKDNKTNRNIIKSLGYTDKDIEKFLSYRKGEIDLTGFVWNYANWFNGDNFSI